MEDNKHLLDDIQRACAIGFELLPPAVLCQSVGAIALKTPLTVTPDTPLARCISLLQKHRIGSLLVVDQRSRITGIFTERDCLMKVFARNLDLERALVADFMTPNPQRAQPDTTIAFALNLMSGGGFRHVPVVDQDDIPIGILSVKDVVDYLVSCMLDGIVRSCETLGSAAK
jgi:CBS domain-containing protein